MNKKFILLIFLLLPLNLISSITDLPPQEIPYYIKEVSTREECVERYACPGNVAGVSESWAGVCEWDVTTEGRDGPVKSERCICQNATVEEICENNKRFIMALEQKQLEIRESERLELIKSLEGECPDNCSCSGAVFKCPFEDTGREMIIYAGKSGKVIIQIKDEENQPVIFVYEVGGEIFRNVREEDKKEINILPEQASDIASEKMGTALEEQEIEIEDEGFYKVTSKKRAKLFWLFPVREKFSLFVDLETGETEKVKKSWWGFLAKDNN